MKAHKLVGVIVICSMFLHQTISLQASDGSEYITDEIETTETSSIVEIESTEGLILSAEAVILIEASTGTVIYEMNADEVRAPASVTKVMTLLLIFEALEKGSISLEDDVVTSSYAASMGGSQIYLEAGEIQTVETMIKSIVVSSANDACVAMAEYISGSAQQFVIEMNEKAEELGMSNTNFVNCNGLDADGHVTTARDIAIMSRELMNNYPEITEYTTIWMEDIVHETNSGSTVFGLTNTNKLLQEYPYTTGLKTGSTDEALYCISATATKDGVDLIAVVMGSPTSNDRTADAITLLNYGFANTQKYEESNLLTYDDIPISKGVEDTIQGEVITDFIYIDTEGNDLSGITTVVQYSENLEAPVEIGDVIGEVRYMLNEKEIGSVDIVSIVMIDKMNFKYALLEIIPLFLI